MLATSKAAFSADLVFTRLWRRLSLLQAVCSVLGWWQHALCKITLGSCSSLLFACSVH